MWTQSQKCKKKCKKCKTAPPCLICNGCVSVRPRLASVHYPPPPPPRNGLARPVPCSVFPPRRTPPPPAADPVNREIYAERRAAAAAESRKPGSFAPTPPGRVCMLYPRPLPALTIIYSISTEYLQYTGRAGLLCLDSGLYGEV